jgi:hypothetical protein
MSGPDIFRCRRYIPNAGKVVGKTAARYPSPSNVAGTIIPFKKGGSNRIVPFRIPYKYISI